MDSAGGGEDRPAYGGGNSSNYTKLFINLGIKDGFYKASFLQFILDNSGLSKADLGRVDIGETRSYQIEGIIITPAGKPNRRPLLEIVQRIESK
jgi:hypothetical protein